jgi:hypothetical protein
MKTIVFVSCVKTKRLARMPAKELFFASSLFRSSYRYAQSLKADRILLLSTEYGLIEPDEIIEPYDRSPNLMTAKHLRAWVATVLGRLKSLADIQNDRFIFLTGRQYSKYLIPHLKHVEQPLGELTIGRRKHFLKAHLARNT